MAPDRMSGPIRLVVSDVDGTLVRSDKTLSPAVRQAVRRLLDAGVGFSIISARPASGMLWIAEELGLSVPIGAYNGGTILRPDGHVLSAVHIDDDIAARAMEMLAGPGTDLWLFARGRWHAPAGSLDHPHVASERVTSASEPVLFSDPREVTGPFDKIVAVSDDHDRLATLEPEVGKALGERATVARSQLYYLDVTAPKADKGHGLAAVAEAAGVPLDQVAVLGDQRNDLPMFARAGFSVAMGQGPEEVRKAATRTTLPNDEDGVAHAIEEILLPMVDRA